jgi:hypothetical protein
MGSVLGLFSSTYQDALFSLTKPLPSWSPVPPLQAPSFTLGPLYYTSFYGVPPQPPTNRLSC